MVDGDSFYDLASGQRGALKMLFLILPKVISGMLGRRLPTDFKNHLLNIFEKTY
jgi:hypothetical protein